MTSVGESKKYSKVLVTGGTGLVGSALKKVAQECGEIDNWTFAGSLDADLTDFNQTNSLFEKHKPDAVIHLAAKVGGLFKNIRCNAEMLMENIRINDNVLRCAILFNVKRLVACLSTCIFPDNHTGLLTEECIHEGPPHFSNYGYAYAKRLLEIQIR